ncbi:MAG: hypothetical protein NUV81_03620 [bacterium]|nr:hypothetical protein [bacterium]
MLLKIFRYTFITFVKFSLSFFGLFALYSYILPKWVVGFGLTAVTWIAIFFISFFLAKWAFYPAMPTNRDMGILLVVWFLVTMTLLLMYGLVFSLRGPAIIFEWEILVQLVFELIAVFLAGFTSRRRMLKHELGEGTV